MKLGMKSSMGIGALLLCGLVAAQPGPAASAAPGASSARTGMQGIGPGWGRGMMGGRFGAGITPGWALMTDEERAAHRSAMRGMKSYEECAAYRDQHHKAMETRAKEHGTTLPVQPRRDVCAALKK